MHGHSPERPTLTSDFKDILSEFTDAKVEFLLVGAHALAVHGIIRATGDLDLWIRASSDNAQRTWNALGAFGAPLHGIEISTFSTPGMVFQMGVPPHRVDIITQIDGVEFDDAWTNRDSIHAEGLTLPVISRMDLIRNKRASGRPKDLLDATALESKE